VSIFTSFSSKVVLFIVCFGLKILFLKFICIFVNPQTVVLLTPSDPQRNTFKISNHKLSATSSVLIYSTAGLLRNYIHQMLHFFHVLLFTKIILHSITILHSFSLSPDACDSMSISTNSLKMKTYQVPNSFL
jgi:hypothetical protein